MAHGNSLCWQHIDARNQQVEAIQVAGSEVIAGDERDEK